VAWQRVWPNGSCNFLKVFLDLIILLYHGGVGQWQQPQQQFRPFCGDQFKIVCTKIKPSADIHKRTVALFLIYVLQEVPTFCDFWYQKVSRNSGITNFETLFSTKSKIGSKIFLKSTFLVNCFGNFFLKFQIFDFSFAYFFKYSYLLLESKEVLH
jgi:hypothetical protein